MTLRCHAAFEWLSTSLLPLLTTAVLILAIAASPFLIVIYLWGNSNISTGDCMLCMPTITACEGNLAGTMHCEHQPCHF